MDAGRDLDALVAEKVMGWKVDRSSHPWQVIHVNPKGEHWGRTLEEVTSFGRWAPSSDIAAAWEVVDKVRLDGWYVEILFMDSAGWRVCLWKGEERKWFPKQEARAIAPTAPLAICLAVLKAVGVGIVKRHHLRSKLLSPSQDWLP